MSGTSLAVAYFLLQGSATVQTFAYRKEGQGQGGVLGIGAFVFWVVLSSALMFGYATHPLHKRAQLYEGLFITGTVLLTAAVSFMLARKPHNISAMTIFPLAIMQAGLLALLWAGQQHATQGS